MKGYLQLVGFWWVRGDEHTPNEGHHSVCGRVQTAAVLVQATVLLSPQSFQFSVLAKCLSVCPAFFCQRDAGESEKEIWNRWKKILSITFPQTLPTYSLHMCAKVFRYAQYFLHKKWVCKVGIFGVLCLNQTCSVHTKIAIFVKMASARPPRVRFDMYCCKYLFLCLHCTCFATMPRAVVCMGCYV